MAWPVFFDSQKNYVLLRNHELDFLPNSSPNSLAYDSKSFGGVTKVVVDQQLNLIEHELLLTGTSRNCSGGVTPWGTWLSGEECFFSIDNEHDKNHGYVFEVNPFEKYKTKPEPITGLGRFYHEAVAVDPNTGYLYLTEDRSDGAFYRFIPKQQTNLAAGGQLQALRKIDKNSNEISWLNIEEPNPQTDTVRVEAQQKGATTFSRSEGISYHNGVFYFTATTGGRAGLGEIYKLVDSKTNPTIEQIFEATDESILRNPDQLVLNSFGDMIICEDPISGKYARLIGITPEGKKYLIAESDIGEWTGVCFSPDHKMLFVNQQDAGITFALNVDWPSLRASAVVL